MPRSRRTNGRCERRELRQRKRQTRRLRRHSAPLASRRWRNALQIAPQSASPDLRPIGVGARLSHRRYPRPGQRRKRAGDTVYFRGRSQFGHAGRLCRADPAGGECAREPCGGDGGAVGSGSVTPASFASADPGQLDDCRGGAALGQPRGLLRDALRVHWMRIA